MHPCQLALPLCSHAPHLLVVVVQVQRNFPPHFGLLVVLKSPLLSPAQVVVVVGWEVVGVGVLLCWLEWCCWSSSLSSVPFSKRLHWWLVRWWSYVLVVVAAGVVLKPLACRLH